MEDKYVKHIECLKRREDNRHDIYDKLNPIIITMGEDITELKVSLAKLSTTMEDHIVREEKTQSDINQKIDKLINSMEKADKETLEKIEKWEKAIDEKVEKRITKWEFRLMFWGIYLLWLAMIGYWMFMFFRVEDIKEVLQEHMLKIDRIEKSVEIQKKFWNEYRENE